MKITIRKVLKKIDHFLTRWNMTVVRWYWIKRCDKDLKSIIKNTSIVLDLNHPSIHEAKNYWRKYNIKLNPKWHAFYALLNNIYSSKYIPEDIFFNYIIPSLNNNDLYKAYTDKNSYDVFMKGIRMPKTVLRCMHGNLYNDSYALLTNENYINSFPPEEVECFIKPALDSGQGKNMVYTHSEVNPVRMHSLRTFIPFENFQWDLPRVIYPVRYPISKRAHETFVTGKNCGQIFD